MQWHIKEDALEYIGRTKNWQFSRYGGLCPPKSRAIDVWLLCSQFLIIIIYDNSFGNM